MASNLAPAELKKNKKRRNVLKTILQDGGVLYVSGSTKKIGKTPKNNPLINALTTNVDADYKNVKVFVSNTDATGISLSTIDKDSRFVDINLGHTFEVVFAAAAIAAIKLRPDNLRGKNRTMPLLAVDHVKEVLEEIVKSSESTIKYEVPGYSFNGTSHDDILILTCEKNTLAFKGAEKFINEEYENKKDKLIKPALAYMNSTEIEEIRSTLCYNGVIDVYHVTVMGSEQTKPDVTISVKREGVEVEKEKLISLKLNSKTFGTVKGATYESLKMLFENFSIKIPITVKNNVKEAYDTAASMFNAASVTTQISSIQKALKNFYSGAGNMRQGGTEVLKFTTKKKNIEVFGRMYEEFTKKFTDKYTTQKMNAIVVESKTKGSGGALFALKFNLPTNNGKPIEFLQIRCRMVEDKMRHEIEEQPGMQEIIGTPNRVAIDK